MYRQYLARYPGPSLCSTFGGRACGVAEANLDRKSSWRHLLHLDNWSSSMLQLPIFARHAGILAPGSRVPSRPEPRIARVRCGALLEAAAAVAAAFVTFRVLFRCCANNVNPLRTHLGIASAQLLPTLEQQRSYFSPGDSAARRIRDRMLD